MLVEKYTVFKSNVSFETSGQAIEFVCARINSIKGWGSLLVSFIVLRLFNVSIPIHCILYFDSPKGSLSSLCLHVLKLNQYLYLLYRCLGV